MFFLEHSVELQTGGHPACKSLTSIRRCGWSGRIASLPVFFFVFWFYLDKPTCRTEGSKCVVPRKEVPFGGLNQVSLNFVGKTSPRLKFWGRESATLKSIDYNVAMTFILNNNLTLIIGRV